MSDAAWAPKGCLLSVGTGWTTGTFRESTSTIYDTWGEDEVVVVAGRVTLMRSDPTVR